MENIFQKQIFDLLNDHIEKNTIKNYLFFGPTSTSKTYLCKLFLQTYFEFDSSVINRYVLHITTNEDRGINVIREQIKRFAQLKICRMNYKKNNCY